MPIKAAKGTELRAHFEEGARGGTIFSATALIFLMLVFYFLASGAMKMEQLGTREEEKASQWNKCLDSYVNQVCSIKGSENEKSTGSCYDLLECIRDGEKLPFPEKIVFMI